LNAREPGLAARRYSPLWSYVPWILGLLTLALVLLVVVNVGEVERFALLMRGARPQWLLLAILLQAATYVFAAGVWQRTLAAAGHVIHLHSLVPLGLAKLFTDQAFPSVGLSGTMVLARGLARRGVTVELATQTLLVTLVSFYAAYLAAAALAVGLLWWHHEANALLTIAGAAFSVVAIAIPAIALALKRWGLGLPPRWLLRLPGFADLLARVASAPTDLLRRKRLLGQTFMLQLCVFLLDASTLWAAFQALGAPVEFLVAYAAFIMASVVATIGPIPVGLGTFEASSVGVLTMLGVDIETALAGTLLLRGMTVWLPMLPGVWLARREVRAARGDARG
jgi:uncharacterized protein (TIRG00374 family)